MYPYQRKKRRGSYFHYSRVHKSWNSFFSKILEKPSIVQKKNVTSYKRAGFFTEMKQKKFKMADLENSKWPPQKHSFSSSANSQYFFMKFSRIGPWDSYGWFFQNLGKEAVPTFMHTTVKVGVKSGLEFFILKFY